MSQDHWETPLGVSSAQGIGIGVANSSGKDLVCISAFLLLLCVSILAVSQQFPGDEAVGVPTPLILVIYDKLSSEHEHKYIKYSISDS